MVNMCRSLRKHAHAIYRKHFGCKNEKNSVEFFFKYFSYFCSKHRLWVHGFNEYPQSMFWSKNKKIRYTTPYPSFAI